jgi:predicted permease
MTALAAVRSWIRATLHRSRVEQRMDDELRFHVESYTDDLVRAGLPTEEARRRAAVEFGGVEGRKDECRDALGLHLLDELIADGRYAFRQLRRSPVFAAVAVLSLALGIGANSAIFSLMEAAVWKPISVPEPERLALFSWASGPRSLMNSSMGNWRRASVGARTSTSFSYPVFDALKHQDQIFEAVFAFKPIGRITAVVEGEAELVEAQLVSGDFYRGVGVAPFAGRALSPSDDVRGGTETVAVISHGYWVRRFGRSPSAIGTRIRVNEVPVTIVGVNAPGFTGVDWGDRADVFMPLSAQPLVFPFRRAHAVPPLEDPDYWWVVVMGRLKPGVMRVQAQSALDVAFQQAIKATLPDRPDRDQPHFELLAGSRGQDNLREQFATLLLVLGALVGVVLLIACANVASLLLARAVVRRRELSLRLALGASRWRLVRQLLTEGLALGVLGGATGLVLAYWTRNAIPGLLLPSWAAGDLQFNPEFDVRVLLLTLAVTLVTTILSSLGPIWQSLRVEINAGLKEGGRALVGPAARRGKSLVVFQVGLSVSLLIGAGLFVRTLANLRSVSLGFRPEHVVLFTIDPPRARYAGDARKALFARLDEAMAAIPRVEAASVSQSPLVSGGSSGTRVGPNGRIPAAGDEAWVNNVGSRFFETMGIPILIGRSFDAHDRETSAPVTVVNQQFARQFFPNENAMGKTIRNNNLLYEVVGICGNTPFGQLRAPVPPTFYRHFTQAGEPGAMTFEVRTAASEAALMADVRAAVRGIDRDLPVFDMRTQAQQIDATLSRERLFAALTSAFGVLALVLASIGIYGLMAHGVSRRTNEIGVRLALGAEQRDVVVMILREASALAVAGAAMGVVAAAALSRYVRAMLFGITPTDPAVIGGAVAAMMAVALLAAWFPARKASRLDPTIALRHE